MFTTGSICVWHYRVEKTTNGVKSQWVSRKEKQNKTKQSALASKEGHADSLPKQKRGN